MDYIEYSIQIQPREPWAEILTAELSDFAFETFQENEKCLLAYLPADVDSPEIGDFIKEFAKSNNIAVQFDRKLIKAQNWNAQWEQEFQPVEVDSFCLIRAPFHKIDAHSFKHEVVIMPKMSFGTGHHPTTFLMCKAIEGLDLRGKNVLDMGCGTGVLGILALKCGAKSVLGIDIEEWAVENSIDNAVLNNVVMEVLLGGVEQIPAVQFDLILANINRNVLSVQLAEYHKNLSSNGSLLLSGFMKQDVDFMLKLSTEIGFKQLDISTKENWVCLKLEKG